MSDDFDDDNDYELESLRLAALSSIKKGERRESSRSVLDPSESLGGSRIIYEVSINDDYELLDRPDVGQTSVGVEQTTDSDDPELRALRNAALQSHKGVENTANVATSANSVTSPESPPLESLQQQQQQQQQQKQPAERAQSATGEPDETIDLLYGDLNTTSAPLIEEETDEKTERKPEHSVLAKPVKTVSESSADNKTTSTDCGRHDWPQAKGRYQPHRQNRASQPPSRTPILPLPLPPSHAYLQQLNLPPPPVGLPMPPVLPWPPVLNPSLPLPGWPPVQERQATIQGASTTGADLPGRENHVPIFSDGSSDSDSVSGKSDRRYDVSGGARDRRQHGDDVSRYHLKYRSHQYRSRGGERDRGRSSRHYRRHSRERDYCDDSRSLHYHRLKDADYYESRRQSRRYDDDYYRYMLSKEHYRSPSPEYYSRQSRRYRSSPSRYYSRSPSPEYWRHSMEYQRHTPPEYRHSSNRGADMRRSHSSAKLKHVHHDKSPHPERCSSLSSRRSRKARHSRSRSRDSQFTSEESSPAKRQKGGRGRGKQEDWSASSTSSDSSDSSSDSSSGESSSENESSGKESASLCVKQSAADSSMEATARKNSPDRRMTEDTEHVEPSPRRRRQQRRRRRRRKRRSFSERSGVPVQRKLKSVASFSPKSRKIASSKESKGRLASAVIAVVSSSSPSRKVVNKDERIIIQTPGRLRSEIRTHP